MIKLVLMDFDDTLCLTNQILYEINNQQAIAMGYPPIAHEVHLQTWGMSFPQALKIRIPGVNVDKFISLNNKRIEDAFNSGKIDNISPQNLHAIDVLLEMGKQLGVVTSRSLQELKHIISKDNPLGKRISDFYCLDNSEYTKPDPRVFDKPLKDFGVSPNEAVYIGDAIGDGIAAKNAGLYFIANLESGIFTQKDFEDKNIAVDYYANSFPEIINYIN